MVKIRLLRAGARKRPYYRLVAIDERRQRDGRALEFLGTYDPQQQPSAVRVDVDKVQAWIERGAILSETARALLKRQQRAGGAEEAAAPAGAAETS